MSYKPSDLVLSRYAKVLINFALNSGRGVKKGEVVGLFVPECAKPILPFLYRTVLESGAHPVVRYLPDEMQKDFYDLASEDQLTYFPRKYLRGLTAELDHSVMIIAEHDKHELKEVDPKKIMARNRVFKPYKDWRDKKEAEGKFTWTLGLYGTIAMAREAKMSLENYWKEIIKACYLNRRDPVGEWRRVYKEIESVKKKLNRLEIEKLHVKGKSVDLTVVVGKNRKWLGGSGRNIPSFELFISPDARGTEGKVAFSEPLYRYGNLIKGVELEFEKGKVVKATAQKGEKLLKEMISVKSADKIGEFSLTDGRHSKITKFMAETLFDENVGGRQGNMHIALGSAYKDSFPGDPAKVTKKQWKDMGYNDSVIHTDIVSTEKRTVTAHLTNGKTKVIYSDGKFTV